MHVTGAYAGMAATRCAGLGLSFLPCACRAGAGVGLLREAAIGTGVGVKEAAI